MPFLLLPSVPQHWRDRLAALQFGFDAYERERVAAAELIAALPLLERYDVPWSVRQDHWRRFLDSVRLGLWSGRPRRSISAFEVAIEGTRFRTA